MAIDWLEIRNQSHLMDAEGAASDEPQVSEIEQAIFLKGYRAEDIDIAYDGLQQVWRFTARLETLND